MLTLALSRTLSGTGLFLGGEQLYSPQSGQRGFSSGKGTFTALSLEQPSFVFDASEGKAEMVAC